jgi:hypothetical protein
MTNFDTNSFDTSGYEIAIYVGFRKWNSDRNFYTVAGVSLDDLPVQGVLGSKFSSMVETTLTKLRPKKPEV